jgi:hypothetical protein
LIHTSAAKKHLIWSAKMARYRKIDTRIWNDQKFNALSNHGKLLFFFLLSHPHMTAIGAMRASLPGLASELGWKEYQLREVLGETFLRGMIRYDEKSSFIWLPNFLKYNHPESPNVIKSWEHALDYLPECDLKLELIESVKTFVEDLSKAFSQALPPIFILSATEKIQEKAVESEAAMTMPNKNNKRDETIQAIFDVWKNTLEHPQAKLDKKRKATIVNALRAGYTPEQLSEAIQGCAVTPHNMGKNDRAQRYDGLGVIFKDADNIDRFIRNAHSPPIAYSSQKPQMHATRFTHDDFDNKSYAATPAESIPWLRGESSKPTL